MQRHMRAQPVTEACQSTRSSVNQCRHRSEVLARVGPQKASLGGERVIHERVRTPSCLDVVKHIPNTLEIVVESEVVVQSDGVKPMRQQDDAHQIISTIHQHGK